MFSDISELAVVFPRGCFAVQYLATRSATEDADASHVEEAADMCYL
jgi:hypothetical protein